MSRRLLAALALAAAALTTAACGAGADDAAPGAPTGGDGAVGAELSGTLTIAAAASLQTAFDELTNAFEAQHPSVHVQPVRYDGSSTLATQLVEGAPADVFASADERTMGQVVDAGLAGEPVLFATNTLTLIVPAGNPGGVTGLADLADPALNVVRCAAKVPCGAASDALLAAAGVDASVDSAEQNVTAVLTKVAAGEADVGLVYVTDAAGSDLVDTVPTDGADAAVNRYPIVRLDEAGDAAVADAFVEFVVSDEGRAVLARLGFGAP